MTDSLLGGGTITTGSIPRFMLEGIRTVFGNKMNEHQTTYTKYYDVQSSGKAYELDVQLGGFGLFNQKDEGRTIDSDTTRQGFTPKYVNTTFAKRFVVTKEAIQDEQYGVMNNQSANLGRTAAITKDVLGANVLNNGFDSAFTMPGGDGLELFSKVHPQGPAGGTYSNELTTPAAFSETSLEAMLIQIGQATDERGIKMALKPKMVLHPTNLNFEVTRVLQSVLQSNTANNDVNAINQMNSVPGGSMEIPYLTDSNGWFVTTDMPDGLKYYIRQEVEFDQENAFETGNAQFKADFRVSPGWTEAKGIFGTEGA